MKRFLVCLALVSCGDSEPPTELIVQDASPCYPEDVETGVLLHCPNQEPVLIRDGQGCSVTQFDGNIIYTCEGKAPVTFPVAAAPSQVPPTPTDGSNVGPQGPKGDKGDKGEPGKDGKTCELEKDSAGCVWAVCSDGTKKKIFNPKDPHAVY